MGLQFHETGYGKRFFDQQLPALIKALNRMADVYEKKQNAAEHTVFVSYHLNLAPLNQKKSILSNMEVCLCNTADVLYWVKNLINNLQADGYIPTSEDTLESFLSDVQFAQHSGLIMMNHMNEDLKFLLVIQKFYVKLEDER